MFSIRAFIILAIAGLIATTSAGCRTTLHHSGPVLKEPSGVQTVQRPTPVPPIQSDLKPQLMTVIVPSIFIRSAPDDRAPIVGKLTKGCMFHVTIERGWARVGEAKYVSVKFLTRSTLDGRTPLPPQRALSSR